MTVTTGNFTGYSAIPFIATFPGAGATFSKDLFNTRIDVPIDNADPRHNYGYFSCLTIADLDGGGTWSGKSKGSYFVEMSEAHRLSWS